MENRIMNRRNKALNSRRVFNQKPGFFSPSSYSCQQRSVKPIEIEKAKTEVPVRKISGSVIWGGILGLISGIVLLGISEKAGLSVSLGWIEEVYEPFVVLFWPICGVIVGCIYGLLLSPFYLALHHMMPYFSAQLYLPTILILLRSLLTTIYPVVVVILIIAFWILAWRATHSY